MCFLTLPLKLKLTMLPACYNDLRYCWDLKKQKQQAWSNKHAGSDCGKARWRLPKVVVEAVGNGSHWRRHSWLRRETQTRKRSIWWSTMNADINGERNLELWPNNDYWCQNNTQQNKTTRAKILQQVGREKMFWMARFFTEIFSARRDTVAGGCGCLGGRPLGQTRSYKASSTVLVEAADEHQRGR